MRIGIAVAILALASQGSMAQGAGNGFLFRKPAGTVALRIGYGVANAGSDLFTFTSSQLTLTQRDYSGVSIDVDVARPLGTYTDVVGSVGFTGTQRSSEFRDFVDQDNAPIRQSTVFARVPVTVALRRYLTPRGRSVGSFAWVPAKLSAYVGAGAGGVWYLFHQSGDFIDFASNDVFGATLKSSRWAPAATATAGMEFTVNPRVSLTSQAGYLWSKGTLAGDFAGFNRIDLSGVSTSVGIVARF